MYYIVLINILVCTVIVLQMYANLKMYSISFYKNQSLYYFRVCLHKLSSYYAVLHYESSFRPGVGNSR